MGYIALLLANQIRDNFHLNGKLNYISKLSSGDKILSLIKKTCRKCTFLNHFREANQQ